MSTLQSVSLYNNSQQNLLSQNSSVEETQKPSEVNYPKRNFKAVSYTTPDGKLFVGFYLNLTA